MRHFLNTNLFFSSFSSPHKNFCPHSSSFSHLQNHEAGATVAPHYCHQHQPSSSPRSRNEEVNGEAGLSSPRRSTGGTGRKSVLSGKSSGEVPVARSVEKLLGSQGWYTCANCNNVLAAEQDMIIFLLWVFFFQRILFRV